MVQTVLDVAGTPPLRPACFYHFAFLLLGSASCGLIECLFLFLQFWLVDHIRSHWPAGWTLAFRASWHCSTDDESFQEPHLSAQWQTLPQLLLFYPPSLSSSSSPSVCPALVVLLSFLHFIIPAWLNSNTRLLSVSSLLSLSLFYHNLTSSSSARKIFNIFNHVRVFDVSGKHPPPHLFLPFINIRAASPVFLRPGAVILGGPPVCSTDTATCRTPYQRRQRTCGNKMRNQKFQDKRRRRKQLFLSNPSFETLGDTEWCKGQRKMRIKLMIGWITEGKDRKQRRTLLLDWDKPQCGTSVYIYLYILCVIKFKLIHRWDSGGKWN